MTREQRRQWRRYVFGCPDLTLAERFVLLALETFADFPDGANAHPGITVLAEFCGLKERVVRYALEQACDLKLIDQTDRANPKAGHAATYRLLPLPVSTGTTVPLETDFNRHETDFKRHETGVSTGTPVPPTNKEIPNQNTKKDRVRATATYLPDDWSPAPELVAQMRAEQPHIDQDTELKIFRDHWRSTDKNPKKRNWDATYRNWIRRAAQQQRPNNRRPTRSAIDDKVAGWQTIPVNLNSEHDWAALTPKELD
jgi:hypothetical protein